MKSLILFSNSMPVSLCMLWTGGTATPFMQTITACRPFQSIYLAIPNLHKNQLRPHKRGMTYQCHRSENHLYRSLKNTIFHTSHISQLVQSPSFSSCSIPSIYKL